MSVKSLIAGVLALAAVGASAHAQAQQVYKVGTNTAGSPWSFHDASSNTERGVSVELIAAIAKDAGFTIELVPMALNELIPALNGNKIDIIAANLLVTPERAAQVAFSDAIAPGGDGLVAGKSDGTEYKTLDDLKGLAVGVQAGPFAGLMQKSGLFPDLKIYPTGLDAMRAISAGEIKAAVVGGNQAAYEIKLGRFPDVKLVKSYKPLVSSVDAFSVRRGDTELLARINAALAKLKVAGTLKAILDKYGFD
jgi:polar amino acid transport system substrate-binding protein